MERFQPSQKVVFHGPFFDDKKILQKPQAAGRSLVVNLADKNFNLSSLPNIGESRSRHFQAWNCHKTGGVDTKLETSNHNICWDTKPVISMASLSKADHMHWTLETDLRPAVQHHRWLQKRFCSPWCHPEHSGVQFTPFVLLVRAWDKCIIYLVFYTCTLDSIHVHWHHNMLLFRLFPVTKDPLAAQYPKQCVLCLPVTARNNMHCRPWRLFLTTLLYIGFKIVETFWNVYSTVEKNRKRSFNWY